MSHTPTLHAQQPLSVFGVPLRHAHLAVLLVHGRTQTPADMFDLLVRRLDVSGLAYCAPAAAGRSWYPERFMAPLDANQPHLDQALAQLIAVSDDLAGQGFAPERQVVMGFSQGACLACEFVWRQRAQRRFAALLSFTGGLIGPAGSQWVAAATSPLLVGLPVLLSNRDNDPWVPAYRTRETAQVLVSAGARVQLRVVPGDDHVVDDDEIALARAVLTEACGAPPRRAATARPG